MSGTRYVQPRFTDRLRQIHEPDKSGLVTTFGPTPPNLSLSLTSTPNVIRAIARAVDPEIKIRPGPPLPPLPTAANLQPKPIQGIARNPQRTQRGATDKPLPPLPPLPGGSAPPRPIAPAANNAPEFKERKEPKDLKKLQALKEPEPSTLRPPTSVKALVNLLDSNSTYEKKKPLVSASVYCPGIDNEMQGYITNMIYYKWIPEANVHRGGKNDLSRVDPNSNLYVICHGNPSLPMVQTTQGMWSAEDLAKQMAGDGLRRDHRAIEMLVCHAGESVTSKAAEKQRMPVYQKFQAAKLAKDEEQKEKFGRQFLEVSAKGPKPSAFVDPGNQVLPMCAQFIEELKKLGFRNILVKAYKASVCAFYADGIGNVHLDIPGAGNRIAARPEHIVTWRSM